MNYRHTVFMLFVFLGLSSPSIVLGQSATPGLLIASSNPGNVPPIVNSVPGQEAFFKANPAALDAGHITIKLPGGIQLESSRSKLVDSNGQFVWIGDTQGDSSGSVIVARRGNILMGTIRYDDRLYALKPVRRGLHRAVEMKPELPAPELPPVAASVAAPDEFGSIGDESATDFQINSNLLDVMVAYTDDAETAVGGPAAILALIDLAVAETNVAYKNSQINASVRLVHTVKVDYNENSGFSTALSRLRSTSDGHMDEVHPLRDIYGADLVSLFIDNSQYCGIAYLGPSSSDAFSVVAYNCATGYYSFGHEFGHNQGSHHDVPTTTRGSGVYLYSHGYQDPDKDFRTVMAYNCSGGCPRVQYFSNPDVYYGVDNDPMGIDHELDPNNSADNARSITNTAQTIANFRTPWISVTSKPASPTGLNSPSKSHDSVDLTWIDASDNETGFLVERSLDYILWSSAGELSAGATSFPDLGLEAETLYYYRVSSFNSLGYSEPSTHIFVTTDPAPGAPAAPTSVDAVFNADTASITINWAHTGINVDHFEVQREKQNPKGNWTGATIIASPSSTDTSVTDQPGAGTYRYSVRSASAVPLYSAWKIATQDVTVPKSSGRGGGTKCHPQRGCNLD